MSSIGNIFRQTNPYENFVKQLVQIESQTKLKLQAQKGVQNEKKTALGAVSSAISKFVSKIDELKNDTTRPFHPLAATSSNKDTVNIETTSTQNRTGTYGITINRLATNDIVLSEIMDGTDTNLSAFGSGSIEITIGEQTETISVETTFEDDQGVVQQKTNSQILEAFSKNIEDAFGDKARANRFNVSGDNVQFSMQSLNSGFENRIQFENATGALAELTNTSTRATPAEELNALFSIDGVNFERSTNVVDDAVEGLTITLNQATGERELLTVNRDINKARRNVTEFVSAFNEMNKTIRDRTFLDAENDRRGALQDNRSIRNLTIGLRQTGLLPMEGVAEGEAARLSDIGISFRNDGTMFIDDEELLTEMLTERPDELARLFTDENSTVSQMKTEAEAFVKRGTGIIATIESGFDQRISRLDARIAAQDRFLERYEEEQRNRFNQLQAIIDQGDRQFAQIMSFRNLMGF
ncbi:MAG: flagellar filament capping protein FliD [Balneolia bacterium]|nr:flagellar filament capping protein FliD [Balneolia bacterium]